MSMVDELKIVSVLYRAIIAGRLTFLLVPNGHKYQIHDVIRLAEIKEGELTGHICFVQVMFVIADPSHGIREGYAALSIKLKIQSSRVKMPLPYIAKQRKKPKKLID